jgi:hypothetical protein
MHITSYWAGVHPWRTSGPLGLDPLPDKITTKYDPHLSGSSRDNRGINGPPSRDMIIPGTEVGALTSYITCPGRRSTIPWNNKTATSLQTLLLLSPFGTGYLHTARPPSWVALVSTLTDILAVNPFSLATFHELQDREYCWAERRSVAKEGLGGANLTTRRLARRNQRSEVTHGLRPLLFIPESMKLASLPKLELFNEPLLLRGL